MLSGSFPSSTQRFPGLRTSLSPGLLGSIIQVKWRFAFGNFVPSLPAEIPSHSHESRCYGAVLRTLPSFTDSAQNPENNKTTPKLKWKQRSMKEDRNLWTVCSRIGLFWYWWYSAGLNSHRITESIRLKKTFKVFSCENSRELKELGLLSLEKTLGRHSCSLSVLKKGL